MTIVVGCTQAGARLLADRVSEYAIFGCGVGTLGSGCCEIDWEATCNLKPGVDELILAD